MADNHQAFGSSCSPKRKSGAFESRSDAGWAVPCRIHDGSLLKIDLNQRSRDGEDSDGQDKAQKPPIRGFFAVIRALKIGHRDTFLSRCCCALIFYGRSILNYILVYVARAPDHQNPDQEVKYQR